MKFNVTEIEFDFDDECYAEGPNSHLMKRSKFVTLHLVYGKQKMNDLIEESLPLVGGALNP